MRALAQLKGALKQNTRAFLDKESGETSYVLSGGRDEANFEEIMIIPNLSDEIIDQLLELGNPQSQCAQTCERCLELERLCDATYVTQGADAYNKACSEMERWQAERVSKGKDPGTQGSLCDGMSWLYERIADLEAKLEEKEQKPSETAG